MLNLASRIADGSLNASIEVVIASRASAGGIEKASSLGIDTHVILQRDFDNESAMHDRITAILREKRIDLACLCGYLRWFRVDPGFRGRVINIHPALLPEFGGRGMHGRHVHDAVIKAGRAESGCTVHVVDDQYDHGEIILQRRCAVLPGDDADTLAERVFEQECIAYPQAINVLADRLAN